MKKLFIMGMIIALIYLWIVTLIEIWLANTTSAMDEPIDCLSWNIVYVCSYDSWCKNMCFPIPIKETHKQYMSRQKHIILNNVITFSYQKTQLWGWLFK